MIWYGIVISGILNFLTKFLSLSYFDTSKMSPNVKQILSYVPSAVFPAIIFPGIFLDINGSIDLENNPKILASVVAVIIGVLTKNILATIFIGLATYWYLIFI
jgi:branched-subunit amino acid transport protein